MPAIQAQQIVKRYGAKKDSITALHGISFSVEKGELFGIIGPDGAGKTSLFRILTTLLLPDGGEASVNGLDVVKEYKSIRNQVGYMPGKFSLYQDLTVAENLQFFATIFNTSIDEHYDLIKDIYVQIEPFKGRRAGALSGGMKQKLALCCALIHEPAVLFLDEPTTGVDAVSRKEFWEMLKGLKERGITILVSTPYMDEASLCDRVALMQNGHMMSIDSPQGIIASFHKPLYAARTARMLDMQKELLRQPYVEDCYLCGEYSHVVTKPEVTAQQLHDFLIQQGHQQIDVKPVEANIEDCFMDLMKN